MNDLVKYEEPKRLDLEYFNKICDIAYASKCYGGISKDTMLNLCMTAHDLGIPVSKALNGGFHIVQGKIVMSAGLMNDMIRKAGHSLQIKKEDTRCVIIGKRRDNGDVMHEEFTLKDAEVAGLLGSPTWKKHPKQMLYNRAMTNIARALFSDVIGNAYCEDESYEIQKIPAAKRPDVDPFDGNTIEVENSIPRLEQKPVDPLVNHTQFHILVEESGTLCNPDDLLEYVAYVANVQKKTPHQVMGQYSENNREILNFAQKFQVWLNKKEVVNDASC